MYSFAYYITCNQLHINASSSTNGFCSLENIGEYACTSMETQRADNARLALTSSSENCPLLDPRLISLKISAVQKTHRHTHYFHICLLESQVLYMGLLLLARNLQCRRTFCQLSLMTNKDSYFIN